MNIYLQVPSHLFGNRIVFRGILEDAANVWPTGSVYLFILATRRPSRSRILSLSEPYLFT